MTRQDGGYLAFTVNTTEETARARFLARYGVAPLEVKRTGGALLAGPIEAGEAPAGAAPLESDAAGQLALFEPGGAR